MSVLNQWKVRRQDWVFALVSGGWGRSSSKNAYLDNADTGGKLGETIEPNHGDMALHRLVRDQQVFGKPSNRDGQCARDRRLRKDHPNAFVSRNGNAVNPAVPTLVMP